MLKIKLFLAGAIAVIVAIFTAYRSGSKSKQNEIKAQAEEAAREYENAGSEAMIGGLQNELKVTNEDIDNLNRNHFS